jgi:hypothetical protein
VRSRNLVAEQKAIGPGLDQPSRDDPIVAVVLLNPIVLRRYLEETVAPAADARRMIETAAHLVDHVIPPLRAAAIAFGREVADAIGSLTAVGSPPRAPVSNARSPARYLWAMLLARLFESLPLVCPFCGADMRIIGVAWISYSLAKGTQDR